MVKESHMQFVLKGDDSPQEDTNRMRGGRGDTGLEDLRRKAAAVNCQHKLSREETRWRVGGLDLVMIQVL